MLDGKALRAAVATHKPDVIIPEIEAIDTETLADAGGRRLARRAFGQSGPADHEPRRHPRIRGARARPDHLALQIRGIARRGDRRRRRSRAALRGEAGDVELGQGPEHRKVGGRSRRRLGLCGREHARRPAARHRRGIHRVRQRDHLADDCDGSRDPVLRPDRPPAGSRRLSRELAARGHRRRCFAFGPAPGAQGRRGARRLRHFRRGVLRQRRPGDLLRAVAAPARHRAW